MYTASADWDSGEGSDGHASFTFPPSPPGDKEKLKVVANSVMVLVDAMVRKSEQQLSDSGKVLQEVLSAAADEKGEWYIPLAPAQVRYGTDRPDRGCRR